MNGADSLVRTLVHGGIDVCFSNPGTSEMHFVAALDKVDGMRCVLGLSEGVVTGAADGYGRMLERPASTLMHLGPGLANGLANLHNARRANTPIVNIVGDHATYHKAHDAPLTSDVEGTARPYSHWVRTSTSARNVAQDAADAVAAACQPKGRISTLILPADCAWGAAQGPATIPASPVRRPVRADRIERLKSVLLASERPMLLLNGTGLRERALVAAGRIAQVTGATLFAPYESARVERGAGRVAVERLPFAIDVAISRLTPFTDMVLAGARPPVAFFAYPGKPSTPVPTECATHLLGEWGDDLCGALELLADALDAPPNPQVQERTSVEVPTGRLSLDNIGRLFAALLPEHAIVIDESVSSGRAFFPLTRGSAPHDWLVNVGGSIGAGLPLAVGAAIACPERKVVCLQGDGSAMYTAQALWTMAHESLDITTVIFANRSYAILKGELENVGAADAGRKALGMLELCDPEISWIDIARGMGVSARRVTDLAALADAFVVGVSGQGPSLIELWL